MGDSSISKVKFVNLCESSLHSAAKEVLNVCFGRGTLRSLHGALISISLSCFDGFSKFLTCSSSSSVDFWNSLCSISSNVNNGEFLCNGERAFHYQAGNYLKMAKKCLQGLAEDFQSQQLQYGILSSSPKFVICLSLYPHLWLKVENNIHDQSSQSPSNLRN